MFAPAEAAIKGYVAANFSAWPIRWQGDPDFRSPLNVNGSPAPFIEAEIIGGYNRLVGFSKVGNRVFIHPGLIRFYLCIPNGTGTAVANEIADQLSAFMQRAEFGQSGDQMVRTLDFSTNGGVAGYEDGNYFVLQSSVPFDFYYAG